jgi:hypothetical protein
VPPSARCSTSSSRAWRTTPPSVGCNPRGIPRITRKTVRITSVRDATAARIPTPPKHSRPRRAAPVLLCGLFIDEDHVREFRSGQVGRYAAAVRSGS